MPIRIVPVALNQGLIRKFHDAEDTLSQQDAFYLAAT